MAKSNTTKIQQVNIGDKSVYVEQGNNLIILPSLKTYNNSENITDMRNVDSDTEVVFECVYEFNLPFSCFFTRESDDETQIFYYNNAIPLTTKKRIGQIHFFSSEYTKDQYGNTYISVDVFVYTKAITVGAVMSYNAIIEYRTTYGGSSHTLTTALGLPDVASITIPYDEYESAYNKNYHSSSFWAKCRQGFLTCASANGFESTCPGMQDYPSNRISGEILSQDEMKEIVSSKSSGFNFSASWSHADNKYKSYFNTTPIQIKTIPRYKK